MVHDGLTVSIVTIPNGTPNGGPLSAPNAAQNETPPYAVPSYGTGALPGARKYAVQLFPQLVGVLAASWPAHWPRAAHSIEGPIVTLTEVKSRP